MTRFDSPTLKEALLEAVRRAPGKTGRETVTSVRALGRVLAEDLPVRKNLPAFDNSAMDGFAFRHEEAGRRLRIVRTVFAGERPEAMLKSGECYRIMTGAMVPADADTVVPVEKCSDVTATEVTIPEKAKAGDNLRRKGEELSEGMPLIRKGTLLGAEHIALLGAQGIMAVRVVPLPRVAVLSTGNEIREPWEPASENEIYNANAFGILAMLRQYGFEGEYHGRVPDDREETERMIAGLRDYDVILTSGGISMGEADYLYDAFLSNGLDPLFHGVNVKPGRPTMMGTMGRTFVMAMPGNPLSTLLNLHALGLPALFAMQGSTAVHHRCLFARMGTNLKLRGGRSEMVLGEIREGAFYPTRGNRYGSGMLTPLAESDAVACFGEEIRQVPEGSMIRVVLLNDPGRAERAECFNERL